MRDRWARLSCHQEDNWQENCAKPKQHNV